MNKMIKGKAQELYPVESHANEHTAFLQGAKFVIETLMQLPINEVLLKIIEYNKELSNENNKI